MWKKPVTEGYILYDFNLYEVFRICKSVETESKLAIAKARQLGEDECQIIGVLGGGMKIF
jgi:hypothetical protein